MWMYGINLTFGLVSGSPIFKLLAGHEAFLSETPLSEKNHKDGCMNVSS